MPAAASPPCVEPSPTRRRRRDGREAPRTAAPQGMPFATAYVSRPLPVDERVAVHHRLTRRRLAVALLTTALLLAATLVALLVFGLLRATHPAPMPLIWSNVISLHPTDGSPEREIVHAVPDRHGDWCPGGPRLPVGVLRTLSTPGGHSGTGTPLSCRCLASNSRATRATRMTSSSSTSTGVDC